MKDVSKYLRAVTWQQIMDEEKEVMARVHGQNRKSKVSVLSEYRWMPYPVDWLLYFPIKGRIRTTAMLVGLMLWQQYKFNKGRQPLKLTGTTRRKFGLRKAQVRRALNALEKASLVTVQRFKHRSPLITLVTGQRDG
jgi:hypothetical protein